MIGVFATIDELKYLYTQAVTVHEFRILVRASLMKSPKVGRLYAVVRAVVMFCFSCRGVRRTERMQ